MAHRPVRPVRPAPWLEREATAPKLLSQNEAGDPWRRTFETAYSLPFSTTKGVFSW